MTVLIIGSMSDFDFYPHICVISRGSTLNPVTGKETPNIIYEGRCYLSRSGAGFRGNVYSENDTVMLDNAEVIIKKGDTIEVTLENGSTIKATVKQAYPIEDEDFGGQDLEIYQ